LAVIFFNDLRRLQDCVVIPESVISGFRSGAMINIPIQETVVGDRECFLAFESDFPVHRGETSARAL
jgi:hypothetical protein